VQFFVNNPFAGLGAIVSGAIVKQVVAANIATAIEGSLAKGNGMNMKLIGATLAITTATLMVKNWADAGDEAVDRVERKKNETTNLINRGAAEERSDTAFLNWTPESGTSVTPEVREKAAAELERLQQLKAEAHYRETLRGPDSEQGPWEKRFDEGAMAVRGAWGDITDTVGYTTDTGTASIRAHDREVTDAGSGAYDKQIADLTALLGGPAKEQAAAATKMASAADVIAKAVPGLNRSNSPTPVPAVK
jgi:hypothetical protein